MDHIGYGTEFHQSYAKALRREKIRGRTALASWAALIILPTVVQLFGFPALSGYWAAGWYVIVILYIVIILRHWDADRVRYRCLDSSMGEK